MANDYLHMESAMEIAQGDLVLYLGSIPKDSIIPTAALKTEFDLYFGSGFKSISI